MHNRPDLLLISTAYGIGGTERAVLSLAQGLQHQDVVVHTVFPEVDDDMGALTLAKQMDVAVSTSRAVHDLSVRRNMQALIDLCKFARSSRAKSVNIHYGINYISIWDMVALRLAQTRRCIASVHHAVPITNTRMRLMTSLASQLCTQIVVTTPAMTQILVEAGVAQHKIVEIPLGMRPPTTLLSREEARTRLGLPQDALIIGSLGRLVPSKGFDDLISGVALIPECRQPIHLVIGSDGPMRETLEGQAAAALGERAHFLGRIDDPTLLYAASDVFALASHGEGFGLVFIEAAFHAVPSVGTQVGGVPYAIAHDQTGLLVPDREPAALAGALSQLLANEPLRRQMGQAAQQRAYKEFSEQVVIKRYKDVLFGPSITRN